MKNLVSIVLAAIVMCGCVVSCNEKPKKGEDVATRSYKFVKLIKEGQEQVEEFTAKNDTDALNQYLERMEKIIVENIDKGGSPYEAMFVISPEGDTLNTNEELLKTVSVSMPSMPSMPTPVKMHPISDSAAN